MNEAQAIHSFKAAARSGTRHMLALRGMTVAVSLLSLILLARLLPPEAFGFAAMAIVVLNFIAIFRDFGLSTAFIQRARLPRPDMNFAFWANALCTLILTSSAVALSPFVAEFYHQPLVQPVMQLLCFTFFVGGLTSLHSAMLRREMRFDIILLSEASGLAAGFIAALIIAYLTHDVWALVLMSVVQTTVSSGIVLAKYRWVPSLTDLRLDKRLLSFGGSVAFYGLLNFVSNNIGTVLLGYIYGPYSVGLFNRAYQLYSLPSNNILQPIMLVMFPFFCKLRSDPDELATAYLRLIARLSLFWVPAAFVLPLVSTQLTTVLLGKQWTSAGPILAWFAPSLAALGMIAPFGQLMISEGRIREIRVWAVIELVVRGGGATLGALFGPAGVAAGFSIATLVIATPAIIWIIGRRGPITVGRQLRAIWPAWLVSLFVGAVTLVVARLVDISGMNDQGALAWKIACAGATWVIAALAVKQSRLVLLEFASSLLSLIRLKTLSSTL
jgi:O-antigen/teichoic acid export membrane protein